MGESWLSIYLLYLPEMAHLIIWKKGRFDELKLYPFLQQAVDGLFIFSFLFFCFGGYSIIHCYFRAGLNGRECWVTFNMGPFPVPPTKSCLLTQPIASADKIWCDVGPIGSWHVRKKEKLDEDKIMVRGNGNSRFYSFWPHEERLFQQLDVPWCTDLPFKKNCPGYGSSDLGETDCKVDLSLKSTHQRSVIGGWKNHIQVVRNSP